MQARQTKISAALFAFILLFSKPISAYANPNYDSLVRVNRDKINLILGDAAFVNQGVNDKNSLTPDAQVAIHLKYVINYLSQVRHSNQSEAQKKARKKNLDLLRRYVSEGEFPRNLFFPHHQPVFIDEEGRYCAVGYLVKEASGKALPSAINQADKYSYIHEIKHPLLPQWVSESGFTVRELGMIQPGYCKFYTVTDSLLFQDITSIAAHSGNLWIGTRHGAIAKWDGEKWSVHLDGKEAKNNVMKFVFDKSGIPAVKFNGGDFLFPEGQGSFGFRQRLLETGYGTNGAVYGLSEEADLLILQDSAWRQISSVPDMENGNMEMPNNMFQTGDELWVLISEKIFRYNTGTGIWNALKVDPDLAYRISGIRQGLNGEVLLGLDGYEFGIFYECENKFSRSGFARAKRVADSLVVLQQYTAANSGLSSDVVFDVVADFAAGKYWAITGYAPDRVDLNNNWEPETRFGNVSALSRDSAGNFLIGRADGEMMLYDREKVVNWSLPSVPTDVKMSRQKSETGEFGLKKTSRGYVLNIPRSHAGEKFQILNITGQKIWQSNLNDGSQKIVFHTKISPGTYYLTSSRKPNEVLKKIMLSGE